MEQQTDHIGDTNKMVTAVEWLIEQIESYEIKTDIFNSMYFNVPKRMIEQAKAMEKEQIIEAHIDGQPLYSCQSEKAEKYYNETYNK